MADKDVQQERIGDGHLEAWMRQGLDELRRAMYADSNVAQPTPEYGIYGTRTPGEIADDRDIVDRDFDEEPSRDELARGYERDIDDDRRQGMER